ncbi:MAG: hypothetical protein FJY10_01955 [Bacteroidetes bacterium]|nr:hypothetical protein [Bacteroidota bacterium]
MKTKPFIITLMLILSASFLMQRSLAQDDVYFSRTKSKNQKETKDKQTGENPENKHIKSKTYLKAIKDTTSGFYALPDSTADLAGSSGENGQIEEDEGELIYAKRIKRFHYPNSGGYYDESVEDYWYDPSPNYGVSIYFGNPSWYWYRPSFYSSYYWGYPYYCDYWWGYPYYSYYSPWYSWYGWNGYWNGYYNGYWNGYWDGYYNSQYWSWNNDWNYNYYYGPRRTFASDGGVKRSSRDYSSQIQRQRDLQTVSRSSEVNKSTVQRDNPSYTRNESDNPVRRDTKNEQNVTNQTVQRETNPANQNTISRENIKPVTRDENTKPSTDPTSRWTYEKSQSISSEVQQDKQSPTQRYYYTRPQQSQQNSPRQYTNPVLNRSSQSQEKYGKPEQPSGNRDAQPYTSPSYRQPKSNQEYTSPRTQPNQNYQRRENQSASPRPSPSNQSVSPPRQSDNSRQINRSNTQPSRSPSYSQPSRSSGSQSSGSGSRSYSSPSRSSGSGGGHSSGSSGGGGRRK